MGFRCGIVGLPNVGKSTLFNALTETQAAQAANYPFCTIEPNVGQVAVPDDRLDKLAAIAGSQKIIPTQLGFVDIAGLVKGASKGEGLGNQFLGNIREVDAVVHVIRCFEDDDIQHVMGSVDPVRDREVINLELGLADLQSVEKRLDKAARSARSGDAQAKLEARLLEQLQAALSAGKPARTVVPTDDPPVRVDDVTGPRSEPLPQEPWGVTVGHEADVVRVGLGGDTEPARRRLGTDLVLRDDVAERRWGSAPAHDCDRGGLHGGFGQREPALRPAQQVLANRAHACSFRDNGS